MTLVLSILLHFIFGLYLITYTIPKKEQVPTTITLTTPTPAAPAPAPKRAKRENIVERGISDRPCINSYGGIGVDITFYLDETGRRTSTRVERVHPGYPAARLGIRPGDIIVNAESLRGEVGTYVTFQVIRGDDIFSHMVKREKICTD